MMVLCGIGGKQRLLLPMLTFITGISIEYSRALIIQNNLCSGYLDTVVVSYSQTFLE